MDSIQNSVRRRMTGKQPDPSKRAQQAPGMQFDDWSKPLVPKVTDVKGSRKNPLLRTLTISNFDVAHLGLAPLSEVSGLLEQEFADLIQERRSFQVKV